MANVALTFPLASPAPAPSPLPAAQPSFDDLGEALVDVDFCVVDLETTGTGAEAAITEIGAARVRGGEVVGEFQTLVNPRQAIPARVSVLTGITASMVAEAPTIDAVLPAFLEFSSGCVMVAHNAGFDMGFLRRASEALEYPWRPRQVVDTLALARQVIPRHEVPNYKLSTLAAHVRAEVAPTHRALDDVRATVDLLHYLVARVGNKGVDTLEDLASMSRTVSRVRRERAPWAKALPHVPGVYWFHREDDDADALVTGRKEVLYVGTSVDVHRRVASYFTASEKRARMEEMITRATGVDHVECRTPLEARVREIRLITAHQPRYNRRSKRAAHPCWVVLTDEVFPRLSIVRDPRDRALRFGPFTSRDAAQAVVEALQDSFPVRRCTDRLSLRRRMSACALAEMGRCPAPCDHSVGVEQYASITDRVAAAMAGDTGPVVEAHGRRLAPLVEAERYEEAQTVSGRLRAFLDASNRHHRLHSLARCPQVIAARRTTDTFARAEFSGQPGWELHVVRHGRLAAAARTRPGESALRVAADLEALAETVPDPGPGMAATAEEVALVADWLDEPGVRLIAIDGDWSVPLRATVGAERLPEMVRSAAGPPAPTV